MDRGEEVHLEVSTADASGGVAFTVYSSGSLEPRVLQSDERILVGSVNAHLGELSGLIAFDSDADGRRAAVLGLGVTTHELCPPYAGPLGVVATLITSGAGQADAILQGVIVKG